jgi:hypothetical protein
MELVQLTAYSATSWVSFQTSTMAMQQTVPMNQSHHVLGLIGQQMCRKTSTAPHHLIEYQRGVVVRVAREKPRAAARYFAARPADTSSVSNGQQLTVPTNS